MKFIIFVTIFFSTNVLSHTWDEPWHNEVSKKATSLGLYKVKKNYGNNIKLELVKHLAGEKTPENLRTSGYYLYDFVSSLSGRDNHEIWLKENQYAYVYLMKDGRKYKLATPTAGYDEITDDGLVAATYRHSLHKTKIDKNTYEKTQLCIFNALHGKHCPEDIINEYILKPLTFRVAELSPEATSEDYNLFFRQHAALESAYLINYPLPSNTVDKFLSNGFFHVQISAVRSLSVSNDKNKLEKLITFIESNEKEDIAKVMAIIMLDRLKAYSEVSRLEKLLPAASEEEVYLGANIMDPRIGTWFPSSVKSAIMWFVDKNKSG